MPIKAHWWWKLDNLEMGMKTILASGELSPQKAIGFGLFVYCLWTNLLHKPIFLVFIFLLFFFLLRILGDISFPSLTVLRGTYLHSGPPRPTPVACAFKATNHEAATIFNT